MIRIYIVRHGIAVEPSEFIGPDESRPLTNKGRERFRRVARAFARLGESIDLLVTSPLVRAVQTAEILAGAMRIDSVQVADELRPSQSPEAILRAVAEKVADGQGVALVGHDPHVSRLLAQAADLTSVEAARIDFRKGSIVRVDVGALPSARPAQARWWIRPKSRDLRHGLPLQKAPGEKAAKAEKHPKSDHRSEGKAEPEKEKEKEKEKPGNSPRKRPN